MNITEEEFVSTYLGYIRSENNNGEWTEDEHV